MKKAIFNWSGGKDSSLALYHVLKEKEYDVKWLLTSINATYQRISMHGVRVELLKRQAQAMGLPLSILEFPEVSTMEIYEQKLGAACRSFAGEGIRYSIFGDIFLEDLRQYREKQLAKVNMQAVFPIWRRSTRDLAYEFIQLGFKAVLVCINEKNLPQSFVGREFDEQLLKDLPNDVDPCGENGEFHTFVYDGPLFNEAIAFERGQKVFREYTTKDTQSGFWYCDLLAIEEAYR